VKIINAANLALSWIDNSINDSNTLKKDIVKPIPPNYTTLRIGIQFVKQFSICFIILKN